jgi:30S ribosomal protein S31
MGKGDKKTKRGKIIIGSHGVSRLKKKSKVVAVKVKKVEKAVEEPAEKKTTKKPAAKKPKKETKESAE